MISALFFFGLRSVHFAAKKFCCQGMLDGSARIAARVSLHDLLIRSICFESESLDLL